MTALVGDLALDHDQLAADPYDVRRRNDVRAAGRAPDVPDVHIGRHQRLDLGVELCRLRRRQCTHEVDHRGDRPAVQVAGEAESFGPQRHPNLGVVRAGHVRVVGEPEEIVEGDGRRWITHCGSLPSPWHSGRMPDGITADGYEWDEGRWIGEVQLPSWRGFQSRRGPYGAIDTLRPSDGTVDITVPAFGDGPPMQQRSLDLVAWVVDQERTMHEAIIRALLANYVRMQRMYGFAGPLLDALMPEIQMPFELRPLIGLHAVHVHDVQLEGRLYTGWELGCTWDDEHGLGFLMCGTRLVQIGSGITAVDRDLAVRDGGT